MSKQTPPAPPRAGLEIPSAEPTRRSGLDLSGIAPHPKPRADSSILSAVGRESGFTSRVGSTPPPEDLPPPRRRVKRSLPMVQFNGRIRPDVLRRIHAFCERERITNGEFLEMAIDALLPVGR